MSVALAVTVAASALNSFKSANQASNNQAGACAEVNAADELSQNVRPEDAEFIDAPRSGTVYAGPNKELKAEYIISICKTTEQWGPRELKNE